MGPRITLPANGAANLAPQVVAGPSGRATVIWVRLGTELLIRAVTVGRRSVPGPVRDVSAGLGTSFQPAVTADARGNVTLAWNYIATQPAIPGLLVRRIQANGGLSPAQVVIPESHDLANYVEHLQPRVAVDPDGNATVAWRTSAYKGGTSFVHAIHAVRVPFDGGPGPIVSVSGPEATGRFGFPDPELAVDGTGNAIAGWLRMQSPYEPRPYAIETRGMAPDGALGGIEMLAAGDCQACGSPGVSLVAASRGFTAAWLEVQPGADAIKVAHLGAAAGQ